MVKSPIRRVDRDPSNEFIVESILNATNKRLDDIRSMVDTLNRIEGNYSILIDGEWGIGKTIFVNQVSVALQSLNQSSCKDADLRSKLDDVYHALYSGGLLVDSTSITHYPIYMNAWSQDFGEDPLISIASIIADNFIEHDDLSLKGGKIQNAITGLISSIKPSLVISSQDMTHQYSLEFDTKSAIDSFKKNDFLAPHKEREEFKKRICSALEESTEERAERFVLFVDELDRCRPEFAVKILETLRFFFDQKNLTIVLSANARALGESISSWYGGGFDGHRYLMRFYDMARSVTSYDVVSFLSKYGIDARRSSYIVKCISGHSLTMRDVNRCLHELKAIHENEPCNILETICVSFSSEIACLIGSKGQAARRDILSGKGIYLLREWVSEFEGVSEYVESYAKSSRNAISIPGTQFDSDGDLTVDPLLAIEELYKISFFEMSDLNEFGAIYDGRANTMRYRVRTYFSLSD